MGAQTYRADLVTSNHFMPNVIFNRSTIITAGVTWVSNITKTAVTIIAGHPYETDSTTIYMYDNNTLTTIDRVRGKVNVLAVLQNQLFVGGRFMHTKNQSTSLAMYDLANQNKMLTTGGIFAENNTPGIVHSIKAHPDGKRVVVGGQFARAGLFDCSSVCVIDPVIRQWNQIAGVGLSGTVLDIVTYTNQDKQKLIVVGDKMIAHLEGQSWSYSDTNGVPGIPTMALHGIDDELIITSTR